MSSRLQDRSRDPAGYGPNAADITTAPAEALGRHRSHSLGHVGYTQPTYNSNTDGNVPRSTVAAEPDAILHDGSVDKSRHDLYNADDV